jgi:hypothetical protein
MGKTYSGTYTNGITLTNFAVNNPVTVTGVIDAGTGDGLLGKADRWTVTNSGNIASASAVGVDLTAGGTVANSGSITGASNGVRVQGGAGSVTNAARIGGASGVVLRTGGIVANDAGGSITGTAGQGVAISGGTGTVTNAGSISGTAIGVLLQGGVGTISNTGSIDGASNAGIATKYGTGNVTNAGAIDGANGVRLLSGGTITNDAAGSIDGKTGNGVFIGDGRGTVTNAGTIAGAGSGVVLRTGGIVANDAGGSITGTNGAGLYLSGGGTVTNAGSITGSHTAADGDTRAIGVWLRSGGSITNESGASIAGNGDSGWGIYLEAGGNIANAGSISGGNGAFPLGIGVVLKAGGTIVNETGGEIHGTSAGISMGGGTVSNDGKIAGDGEGIVLVFGGSSIVNESNGTVIGGSGIFSDRFIGRLTNDGVITGHDGDGVALLAGGSIVNDRSASIFGRDAAILVGANAYGAPTTVTNFGSIAGQIGFEVDDRFGISNDTLINAGTITGAGGIAVEFGGGNDLLVVHAGAVFHGEVDGGGGTNQVRFGSPGIHRIGNFIGFEEYYLADGGANSLTVRAENFTGVTGSVITIYDGNAGNTIDAASLPAGYAVTVYAGPGRDVIIGGAGNDVFFADGNTEMKGGHGANEFVFAASGHNKIVDFALSWANEIVFSNSGFDLGLSGATATPQLLPRQLFVENLTGHFTSTKQRFAYGFLTGDLYYSAHGSAGSRELVADLAGHPHLHSSQLFFIS